MARLTEHPSREDLLDRTKTAIHREKIHRQHRDKSHHIESKAIQQWKRAATLAVHWARSKAHYQDHLNICTSEHMSSVDPYDGKSTRCGKDVEQNPPADVDLLVVEPAVDGRFKDVGRN